MREKGSQITVRDANSSYSRLLVLFLVVVVVVVVVMMMMMMMIMCTMIVISRSSCSCSSKAGANWIYLGTPWTGGSASIKPPIDPQLDIRLSNNSTTCHWHTSIPCSLLEKSPQCPDTIPHHPPATCSQTIVAMLPPSHQYERQVHRSLSPHRAPPERCIMTKDLASFHDKGTLLTVEMHQT